MLWQSMCPRHTIPSHGKKVVNKEEHWSERERDHGSSREKCNNLNLDQEFQAAVK